MPQDPKAEKILIDQEKMEAHRASNWDSNFQELRELVRPNAMDFNRQTNEGRPRTDAIFDGTAIKASQECSSGIHAYATSPASRWFMLNILNDAVIEDDDTLLWLENVSDLIYAHYSFPEVGLNTALHEDYLDLVVFGTSVIEQDLNYMTGMPIIRAFPLAACWIKENAMGQVDTTHRKEWYTTRQAIQMFGDGLPREIYDHKDMDQRWEFIHAIYPRTDRNPEKYDSQNMAFASCWVNKDKRMTVKESGYHENPYHVSRWTKTAGEIYGRSPALDCLPDIRMINAMSKTVLRAAQKVVDPPIICDDDGVLLPLKTFPGGVILKTPGSESPQALQTHGRVDLGNDMMNQRRDFIRECFFVDYLRRQQKKERQTQLEITDERDEMHRMMSPILGRIQGELLTPMLRRTYNMLLAQDKLPPPPQSLLNALGKGHKLTITYISPAARAQLSGKIIALQQALQDIQVFATVNPNVLDAIDTDKAAQQIVTLRDVSRKILRSPSDIAAIRDQRNQAMQLSQGAQIGATMAGGIKDVAMGQAALQKAANG